LKEKGKLRQKGEGKKNKEGSKVWVKVGETKLKKFQLEIVYGGDTEKKKQGGLKIGGKGFVKKGLQ